MQAMYTHPHTHTHTHTHTRTLLRSSRSEICRHADLHHERLSLTLSDISIVLAGLLPRWQLIAMGCTALMLVPAGGLAAECQDQCLDRA